MFYSPRKIKNYKPLQLNSTKLYRERITYQELLLAKRQLDQLKQSYNNLVLEDFSQLKNILKNSTQVISQLLFKKNLLERQLQDLSNQVNLLDNIKQQLQQKQQKTNHQFQCVIRQLQNLQNNKQNKDNQILILDQKINQLRKSIEIQKEILQDIKLAEKQLNQKLLKAQKILAQTNLQIDQHKKLIINEQIQINNLKHQITQKQLKVQNLNLKIQNEHKLNQNYHHRLQISKNQIEKNIQNKYLLTNQSSTQSNIDQLIQICLDNCNNKQNQHSQCVNNIQQLNRKIHEQQQIQKQLNQEYQQKLNQIKQIKQKNNNIRTLLNNIFDQDTQIIKTIANKKVYQVLENYKINNASNADTSEDFHIKSS